ncbi:Hint domain-containing protein [Swingsia samuiensis]|uniref:Hedgehog/Intein (Hint) domain-containing protein n=1 Tax=Swingsia samuiensis TaxID=1293412 RepID=A0A4Y6UK28_9PROT|nr:Hint domain-containing protein [Swingsia samuiensis]QDH16727.1 hypothetical protein E3D00_03445 [Swingsia samuiensis]
MAITWSKDTTYSIENANISEADGSVRIPPALNKGYPPGTNQTNTVFGTYPGSILGIASITIPKGTTISSVNDVVPATITFNSLNPLYANQTFQVLLKYYGYNTYAKQESPSGTTRLGLPAGGASTPDFNNIQDALNFSFVRVVPNSLTGGRNLDTTTLNKFARMSDVSLLPTYTTGSVSTYPDGTLYRDIPSLDICFLSGTEIKTSSGFKKVEDIQVGDFILSPINGIETPKAVTSIQRNRIACLSKKDMPVCFKQNSIADGVPYKDLYVTNEHCLFFNNKLIPARMLVNGLSIIVDESFSEYDSYHIECEEHCLLIANGAYTESYLDTTHTFEHHHNIIQFGQKTWEKDAVFPLTTNRGEVEPIFASLRSRATSLNYPNVLKNKHLTHDPDVKLYTSNNTEILPLRVNEGRYIFHIPANHNSIRLSSRASQPSETIGPFVDDRRFLGVLVGEVLCFQEKETYKINDHLIEPTLSGWHSIENSQHRWTKGDAFIPLNEVKNPNKEKLISIQISNNNAYIL